MKVLIAALAVIALVAGAVVYTRIGWSRMENACASDGPGAPQRDGVSHSWGWQPLGFTCTYSDGSSETSLWF